MGLNLERGVDLAVVTLCAIGVAVFGPWACVVMVAWFAGSLNTLWGDLRRERGPIQIRGRVWAFTGARLAVRVKPSPVAKQAPPVVVGTTASFSHAARCANCRERLTYAELASLGYRGTETPCAVCPNCGVPVRLIHKPVAFQTGTRP